MNLKAVLLDDKAINRTLIRISHEIIERNDDLSKIILVGIERKGTPIAKEIQKLIYMFENINSIIEGKKHT